MLSQHAKAAALVPLPLRRIHGGIQFASSGTRPECPLLGVYWLHQPLLLQPLAVLEGVVIPHLYSFD